MNNDQRMPAFRAAEAAVRPAPEKGGAGFVHLERLLEEATPEEVGARLAATYGVLERLVAEGDGRQRPAARKAMVAYERLADLVEYLFETKRLLAERARR